MKDSAKPERGKEEEEGTLKSLNMKDIKMPSEYSGKAEEFVEWYQKFHNLLVTRHSSWADLLKVLEAFKEVRIPSDKDGKNEDLINELKKKDLQRIVDQCTEYKAQLFSYLTSYTTGQLHTRVVNGTQDEVFDTLRDIIHKGRDRNEKRMITMKSTILQPPSRKKSGSAGHDVINMEARADVGDTVG